MESKKVKNSAFPINSQDINSGMSKRFYAACAAMQGLVTSNPEILQSNSTNLISPVLLAEYSYQIADELLKQEY